MTENKITRILKKHGLESEHYMNFYKTFPDNIWFEPNNKKDESVNVANLMQGLGLLEKMISPQWNNGSFIGYKIQFKKLNNTITGKL